MDLDVELWEYGKIDIISTLTREFGDYPNMIEALKDDQIVHELGGRFKFTSLVQHRIRQLMDGARPLIERQGRSDLEIAIVEVVEGKIRPSQGPGNAEVEDE